jgi:hypothetical protein
MLQMLEKFPSAKFQFDSEAAEHYVELKIDGYKHRIFYPTQHSIQVSLQQQLTW